MSAGSRFLLPIALLVTSAGYAQTVSPQTVTGETREMGQRLHLNEGQYVKLLTLNRIRLTRQREIEQTTDATARASQLAELQDQYELECGRIMSPTQLSQLQQGENQGFTPTGNG